MRKNTKIEESHKIKMCYSKNLRKNIFFNNTKILNLEITQNKSNTKFESKQN